MSASRVSTRAVRPRDTAATRRAILDAAQAAFAPHGYAGARVDEIARASGDNKTLIFRHSHDKAGLYVAVVGRLCQRSDAAYGAAIPSLLGPDDGLDRALIKPIVRASVRWSFAHLQGEPDSLRLFVWEMAEGWRAFPGDGEIEPSTRWGLDLLGRAQARGVIRPEITPDTLMEQMVVLPLTTLAARPRFAALRQGAFPSEAAMVEHLQELVAAVTLHAILPDPCLLSLARKIRLCRRSWPPRIPPSCPFPVQGFPATCPTPRPPATLGGPGER